MAMRIRETNDMMMKLKLGVVMMALVTSAGVATAKQPELAVVDSVDLERYLGEWYEIASYPAWFQRGCTAVTASYSLRDDGLIKVVNSCRKGSLDGKLKQSTGRARVVDTETNAKLKVSFFRPFWGNYWIIDLDPDYQWAVVGEPKRKYLWILSRTPTMDEEIYQQILARLPGKGYDPRSLQQTVQPHPQSEIEAVDQ
jgi:apolipoprotein D and lipocalin family protein